MKTDTLPQSGLDAQRARRYIDELWRDSITPTLVEYVKIPNKSPNFDAAWDAHGYMADAVALAEKWVRAHAPADATIEVVRLEKRTPVLLVEIPGTGAPGTVLLYGHLDKQPEMTGWADGLGPWVPVIRDEKLYGRGGADDGYAVFASLAAINALRAQGLPHARCTILIETCEESGSYDLPAYIDHLAERLGAPDLVVCLDSGCGNYDQMWCTTSLRGLVAGTLRVDILREGVHSGDASGVVPSSFRIARQLIERVEDAASGHVKLAAFHTTIPEARVHEARAAAATLGEVAVGRFPWVDGARPMTDDVAEAILNRTWRPTLSVTGADGLPPIADAGNVLRPYTALRLSLRIPPRVDANAALAELRAALTTEVPYGAKVSFNGGGADGWNAPPTARWLADALDAASQGWFDRPAMYMGEGGTIPFMGMLGEKFPAAQFVITGVLGPGSNAHGPNEFLHLPMARKLTGCISDVLALHARRTDRAAG
ncbi:MAG: M20 family metallopeptidase [Myxococcales bacterium]|nr:M20 family metallopeptidase [Myxococcales bacterium]